jgi:hypothetical protein
MHACLGVIRLAMADEAGKKKSRLTKARETQKCVTLWLEDDFVEQIEKVAAEKGWPRSLLIENLLRKEVGMPELTEPKFGTNIGRLKDLAYLKEQTAQAKKKTSK